MNTSMKKISDLTALSRPIDPTYPTNRLIMIITVIAGVIAGGLTLLNGQNFESAILRGFMSGATTFLTWAISRELSPDYEYASIFAAILAATLAWLMDVTTISLLGGATILIGARLLNRVVGVPARVGDTVISLLLAISLAVWGPIFIILFIASVMMIDSLLDSTMRRQFVASILAILIFIFAVVTQGLPPAGPISSTFMVFISLTVIVFSIAIIASQKVITVADLPDLKIDPRRVQITMSLTLISVLMIALWQGEPAIRELFPVWGSMLGIGLFRLPSDVAYLPRIGTKR